VSISFALFFIPPKLTFHPVIFGQGKRKPLSDPTSLLASSFSFALKERERTCGKLCIYGNGTSFDETVSLTTIPVNAMQQPRGCEGGRIVGRCRQLPRFPKIIYYSLFPEGDSAKGVCFIVWYWY
jgi:hypothetical protein